MNKDYGIEDGRNLKLIIALARFSHIILRETIGDLTGAGLTESQFGVLETLYHKGPMTVNQVISKTLSTSGNIGVVVDNLIKSGLVRKEVSPSDKRSRILTITQKGSDLMDELFPKHINTLRETLAPLSDEEKETVISIFKEFSRKKGELK